MADSSPVASPVPGHPDPPLWVFDWTTYLDLGGGDPVPGPAGRTDAEECAKRRVGEVFADQQLDGMAVTATIRRVHVQDAVSGEGRGAIFAAADRDTDGSIRWSYQ